MNYIVIYSKSTKRGSIANSYHVQVGPTMSLSVHDNIILKMHILAHLVYDLSTDPPPPPGRGTNNKFRQRWYHKDHVISIHIKGQWVNKMSSVSTHFVHVVKQMLFVEKVTYINDVTTQWHIYNVCLKILTHRDKILTRSDKNATFLGFCSYFVITLKRCSSHLEWDLLLTSDFEPEQRSSHPYRICVKSCNLQLIVNFCKCRIWHIFTFYRQIFQVILLEISRTISNKGRSTSAT